MTATDELQALLDKATAVNDETFAQTVDRIICEHSAWIGCPNKQVAEKIAFSALARASVITERADSNEITALLAEVERLREALREANETIIAFAGPWAARYAQEHNYTPGHLHPKHYDILAKAGARMDDFTRAALAGQP